MLVRIFISFYDPRIITTIYRIVHFVERANKKVAMSANPVVAAAPTAAVAANQGYSSDRPDIGTYKSTTVATLAKAGGVISSSVEANKQQQQQLEDGQIYYDSSSSVGNSSNNNSLSSSEIRFRGRGGLDDDWSTIKAEVIGVTASQSQQDRVHSHYA